MSGEKVPMSIDEYASLEEAVMAKPTGREFLREYARRHRVTGADDVLRGLTEFKDLLMEQREPEQVGILRAELREMSASIAQTRLDIRAINPDEASDNRIMAATEELDAIVTAAERATTDILGHAEQLTGDRRQITRERFGYGAVRRDRHPCYRSLPGMLLSRHHRATNDEGREHTAVPRTARKYDDRGLGHGRFESGQRGIPPLGHKRRPT